MRPRKSAPQHASLCTSARLALLAAMALAAGCQPLSDLANRSNAVSLEGSAASGLSLDNIRLTPSTTTLQSRRYPQREKPQLELGLDLNILNAQPNDARLATRLRCKVNDRTVASEWTTTASLKGYRAGQTQQRRTRLDLGWSVFATLDSCEVSFARIQRTNNLAAPPIASTHLGDVCYANGKLTKGPCPAGVLPATAATELPAIDDAVVAIGPAPEPGRGIVYAPGVPIPRFEIHFQHMMRGGSRSVPHDGHRLTTHCATSRGTVAHFMGYPTQAKDILPGDWRSFDHSGFLQDQPTRCQFFWQLGGGSLTPNAKPSSNEEFARLCWDGTAVTKGDCSPAVPAPVPPAATSATTSAPNPAPADSGSAKQL